jgi:hypothetical protein
MSKKKKKKNKNKKSKKSRIKNPEEKVFSVKKSAVYKKLWDDPKYKKFFSSKRFARLMSCRTLCTYDSQPELKEERSKKAKNQWKNPEIRAKMIAGMKRAKKRMKEKENQEEKRINDYSGVITYSELQKLEDNS